MNITNSQMKALMDVYAILPHDRDFANLPKHKQDIIVRYDVVLLDLMKKKIKDNKRTAEYIANKRKENKNYAR